MATKNNPGRFDCYTNADPDEPMFVLLGRDPVAPVLVRLWIVLRDRIGKADDPEKLLEAEACAEALERWAESLGKADQVVLARKQFLEVVAKQGESR